MTEPSNAGDEELGEILQSLEDDFVFRHGHIARDTAKAAIQAWSAQQVRKALTSLKLPAKNKCGDCGAVFGDDDGHKRLGDDFICPVSGELTAYVGDYVRNGIIDDVAAVIGQAIANQGVQDKEDV
jgi:hypothetical protein